MDTTTIRALDVHTAHICALRLVGGFDSEKRYFPALKVFQSPNRERLQYHAELAEVGCRQSQMQLENLIIGELLHVKDLELDGKLYVFDIQTFQCPVAMDYVLWEVLAQINDD